MLIAARTARALVSGFVAAACTAAAVLAAQSPQATPSAQQQAPTFRTTTNLIHVDVYPRKDGRILDGLTQQDFQIFEDGQRQSVANFQFIRVEPGLSDDERHDPNNTREMYEMAADPANRVFVLYLDTYHVTIAGGRSVRTPLVKMLNHILAPTDLFGVLTPDMAASEIAFQRRVLTVDEMLGQYWAWGRRDTIEQRPEEQDFDTCYGYRISPSGQTVKYYVDDDGAQRWLPDVLRDRNREDLVLRSLDDLVSYLRDIRQERKAVVLFSAGWRLFGEDPAIEQATPYGNNSESCRNIAMRLGGLDDQHRFQDLMQAARRANVVFYPVSPEGLMAFDTPLSEDAMTSGLWNANVIRNLVGSLQTLAKNTDGLAVVNQNNLDAGLAQIADDLSAYYVLGYYSTNQALDGKYRRIEVKVDVPGVAVAARHGYVAPTEAEMAPSRAPASGPSADALVLSHALGALARIQPSTDVYASGALVGRELVVTAELAGRLLSTGHWSAGATVEAMAAGPHGEAAGLGRATIPPGARGAEVRLPVDAGAAGPWHVQLRVRDDADDPLTAEVDVPASGGLLGSPVIERGTASGVVPLHPAADPGFRRTERVHVEWATSGALDSRQARVLSAQGAPLPVDVSLTTRSEGVQTMLAADLVLAPLAPGDYVIEVTASAGTVHDRQLVAIRVGR